MSWKSLEVELTKALEEYADKVEKVTEKDLKKVAQNTAKELRATSPKKTGEYARGWTVKRVTGFGGLRGYTVYNKAKPGLTHLLEKGHKVRPTPKHPNRKNRVNGFPHIKPAEEKAKLELIRMLEADL